MTLKSREIDIYGGVLVGKIPMESIVDVRDNSDFNMYTSPTRAHILCILIRIMNGLKIKMLGWFLTM